MRTAILVILAGIMVVSAGIAAAGEQVVMLQRSDDPTVSFRIVFNVGSQDDPDGKEGIAAMTASLITEGSSERHSYEQIVGSLYPIAASFNDQVDKEMTTIYGRTHIDNLDLYYSLLSEVILMPAFTDEDFNRVKTDYINYVKTSLRYSQDERLGKEVLYEFIFAGTPYEHNEEGRVQALESITVDDVRSFYNSYYTWDNVTIGIGGGFGDEFVSRVTGDFRKLPQGVSPPTASSEPLPITGMEVMIVEKDAASTGINFGFPIDVKRGSKDFYALAIATSWLGEHRNGFSHLFDVIREQRGLNYGDYAYIEHFPLGHRRQFPPPNVARDHQIFQIWIRPVPHEATMFAFRAAVRELESLVDNGMNEEDFELTRKFLKGYILHYAPTTMTQLGYAIDDEYYGIDDGGHWRRYAEMLDQLTLADVNAALKKYFNYENMKVVFITNDAAAVRDILLNNTPSPITYDSEKPAALIEEDKLIAVYPLNVPEENVTIVKVEELFEG